MKTVLQFIVGVIPIIGPLLLALWLLRDFARDAERERERQDDLNFRAEMFILQQPGGAEFLLRKMRGEASENIRTRP